MSKTLPGLNIQYPISQSIVKGDKTIETRTYPLPSKYIGCEMALIETPGERGDFKARIVAVVQFGKPFLYESKAEFTRDFARHRVKPDSKWSWGGKPKWGWPVKVIKRFKSPIPVPCRTGIRFTTEITIEL